MGYDAQLAEAARQFVREEWPAGHTVFRAGEFRAADVTIVWITLVGYSAGLLASASTRVYQSAFFALRDTATPARSRSSSAGCCRVESPAPCSWPPGWWRPSRA